MARQINPTGTWDSLSRQYAQFRSMRERAETEEGKLKKDILGVLADRGQELSGGHRYLPLPEPLKIGKKWVKGFQRQRRVSQRMDEIKAMAWLKANGLLDECMVTETRTYLNEDAVLALNFKGTIPDPVMQDFYTETETFALTLDEASEDDLDQDS